MFGPHRLISVWPNLYWAKRQLLGFDEAYFKPTISLLITDFKLLLKRTIKKKGKKLLKQTLYLFLNHVIY